MTTRRGTLRSTIAPVVLVLALLGACSSGDDGDVTEDVSTTTTEPIDLDAVLLTPEDLATGDSLDAPWIVGDVSAGVDIQLPDCVVEAPTGGTHVEAQLITDNQYKLPSLEQDVTRYEANGAFEAFTAATTRLDECVPIFVFEGTPSTGVIDRLALTLDADQSTAWRTTVTVATVQVAITTVHMVVGNVEMSLVHVNIGTPDPEVIKGYATKALAKLG